MITPEQTNAVEEVLKGLCSKFRFGYYDEDDMKQEGWIFALDALERYDGKRPLINFLRVHIRNRFISLRRNKLSRYEPPCTQCPFYDPDCKKSNNKCSEFVNKLDCDKWDSWIKRNTSKENLMRPIDLDSVTEDNDPLDEGFDERIRKYVDLYIRRISK